MVRGGTQRWGLGVTEWRERLGYEEHGMYPGQTGQGVASEQGSEWLSDDTVGIVPGRKALVVSPVCASLEGASEAS